MSTFLLQSGKLENKHTPFSVLYESLDQAICWTETRSKRKWFGGKRERALDSAWPPRSYGTPDKTQIFQASFSPSEKERLDDL